MVPARGCWGSRREQGSQVLPSELQDRSQDTGYEPGRKRMMGTLVMECVSLKTSTFWIRWP